MKLIKSYGKNTHLSRNWFYFVWRCHFHYKNTYKYLTTKENQIEKKTDFLSQEPKKKTTKIQLGRHIIVILKNLHGK